MVLQWEELIQQILKKLPLKKQNSLDLREWVFRKMRILLVLKLTKKQYTDLFGPSKGDKIRLGDTDILIEVEKDFFSMEMNVYLEEVKQSEMVLPKHPELLMQTALWTMLSRMLLCLIRWLG